MFRSQQHEVRAASALRRALLVLVFASLAFAILLVGTPQPPAAATPRKVEAHATTSAPESPVDIAPASELTRVEMVSLATPAEAVALIESLGGSVELQSHGRIQALLPVDRVRDLERSSDLVRLEGDTTVVPLQAASTSRSLLGVDRWREAGFTGHGVKLAVLDGGFRGYESRLGRTLPPTVTARSFRTGVDVGAGADHGTLAAEVVYSIAPGARLYLVSFGTVTELSAAVDYLSEEGVEIVSFSLGFLHSGPGDGTGAVNDIVSRSLQGGTLWTVAAGNWARQHWRGPYVDLDSDSVHEFATGVTANSRVYQAGDLISVSLRWDDPWGAACSDFDLELFSPSGSLVRASRRTQECRSDPVEGFQVLATETGYYSARIIGAEVRAPHVLDLLMVGSPDRGDVLDLATPPYSLAEPADHAGVISVGALSTISPIGAAAFSSRGPTADGRAKPEVLSPTGGAIPSLTSFAGTSAAAPHVAGVAAMLREALPTLSANSLARELVARSVDIARNATPGAPEALSTLGTLDGLGALIPPGASAARLVGSPPGGGGLSLMVYLGPNNYPSRFAHLLTPGREPAAYFRFDEASQSFERYIVGAPARVQTFSLLSSGSPYVVRFAN